MQCINTWLPAHLIDVRIFFLAVLLTSTSATSAKLAESDSLPDLSTYGLEGELPDLDGKVVLLDFWASWCTPCKASFPAMDQIYQDFKDQGFVILAVSVDTNAKEYEKFIAKSGVSFPLVRDAQNKLVRAAEIEAMPTSLMIDRKGVIRSVHKGYLGKVTIEKYRDEIQSLLAEKS